MEYNDSDYDKYMMKFIDIASGMIKCVDINSCILK